MSKKSTPYSLTEDLIPILGPNVLQSNFEDEFAKGKKKQNNS